MRYPGQDRKTVCRREKVRPGKVEKPAWAVRQSSLQGRIHGESCGPGPEAGLLRNS